MKKIDRYISSLFIKSFFIALISFMNIFILSQLFKVFRFVADGDMSSLEGFYYILAMLPEIIVNVTPLAVLLGALMCISKMAENLEIISLKTSGISFKRIIAFPIMISFIISIIVFLVNGQVSPRSERIMRKLKGDSIDMTMPVSKKDAFYRDNENNLYMIEDLNIKEGLAEKLQIVEMDATFENIKRIVFADSGVYNRETKLWELENVEITNIETKVQEKYSAYSSGNYDDAPERFVTLTVEPETLTNGKLRNEIKKLADVGEDPSEKIQELAKRYSFPFASFVIVFLGLALGSRYVRNAKATNLIMSIFLGYGYYIVQGTFEAYGKNSYMNPFLAGWIPNIIFLVIGIYFVQKAEY